MKIIVYSEFDNSILDDENLIKYIDNTMKESIPDKYYKKITLHVYDYKKHSDFEEARAGAEDDPLEPLIQLSREGLEKRYIRMKEAYNEIFHVNSFNECLLYAIFHEVGHIIGYFNDFDIYEKFIREEDVDTEGSKLSEEYAESIRFKMYRDFITRNRKKL